MCVGLVAVVVVSVCPSPKSHWNSVLELQALLKPVCVVFKNNTEEPTQLLGAATLKFAVGPVYTRIGEIEASLLSHKLIAFIRNMNWFPGRPQEEVV